MKIGMRNILNYNQNGVNWSLNRIMSTRRHASFTCASLRKIDLTTTRNVNFANDQKGSLNGVTNRSSSSI